MSIDLARTVAAVLLAGIFVWIAALNWVALVWQFTRPRSPSWMPLLGGLVGVAAILLAPLESVRAWWWLAFLLDAGSVPGFAVIGVWHLLHAGRSRR